MGSIKVSERIFALERKTLCGLLSLVLALLCVNILHFLNDRLFPSIGFLMSGPEFPIEKTKYGEQYLIPGTEKKVRPLKEKQLYKCENNQFCLPGTEPRISQNQTPQRRVRNKRPPSQKEKSSTLDLFEPFQLPSLRARG